jgi:hypothetical protein
MAPKTWSGGTQDPAEEWCNHTSTSISGAKSTAIGEGGANTTAMVGACSSGAGNSARAYEGNGLTDWFLPSKNELNAMFNYKDQITDATYGFVSFDYWSSSQTDGANPDSGPTVAWSQNLDSGNQDLYDYESDKLRVRPVRAF